MTGAKACRLRVGLVDSIQLTTRFSISLADFFSNNGPTNFINRMAALLNITDTSRIKIVGVYSGSVIVNTMIEDEGNADEYASVGSGASRIKVKRSTLDKLYEDGTLDAEFTSAGFGSLESYVAATYLV